MSQRGNCPGCGATVSFRENGTPYRHKRSGYRHSTKRPWCDGRKRPEEET